MKNWLLKKTKREGEKKKQRQEAFTTLPLSGMTGPDCHIVSEQIVSLLQLRADEYFPFTRAKHTRGCGCRESL